MSITKALREIKSHFLAKFRNGFKVSLIKIPTLQIQDCKLVNLFLKVKIFIAEKQKELCGRTKQN